MDEKMLLNGLRKYLPNFVTQVDPFQLLPYLQCLSRASKEEIICRQDNKGKMAAAQELYSHIIRYRERGVRELVAALRSNDIGLVELADLIDPSSSRETEETTAELEESLDVSIILPDVSDDCVVSESVLPPEIQCMDKKSQQLYKEALASGKEKVYNIRLMVIGHQNVGKTSLVKRLLGEEYRENETESTEGIEVHTACCQIDHETKEWNRIETDPKVLVTQRMAHVMHEHVEKERSQHNAHGHNESDISQTNETEEMQIAEDTYEREVSSTQKKMSADEPNQEISDFVQSAQSLTLPSSLSSCLTILDFAGQFQYYTTHQTFMSRRTMYLLVTDMSLDLTDSVQYDSCGMDVSGKKLGSVQDPKVLVTQRMAHVMHEHVEKERSQHNAHGHNESDISQTNETEEMQIAEDTYEREVSSTQKKMSADEPNQEISEFVQSAQSLTLPSSLSSCLTILDFAGQFQYYTTHQTFMSRRTMYLLVTDMSLDLTDSVQYDSCGMDVSGKKLGSVQDYVIYWFNSVHSYAFLPVEHNLDMDQEEKDKNLSVMQKKIPPVILVGTHCDKIPNEDVEKKTKEHFEKIRRLLQGRPLRDYLVEEFAVSNVKRDSKIDALKRRILELAETQDYWGQEIPARWLALRKALIQIKEKKVVDYTEVESLNQSLLVKIESNEELDLFLEFEHELGNVIFFRIKELRAEVVLDPQWLMKGLKIWITSDEIVKKYPDLEGDWFRFKDTGQLTETLIDLLWSVHPEFHQHKQHLLAVMERLNIIAKPLMMEPESKEDNYYWVPCMVQKSAVDYLKMHQKSEGVTKTPTLCFVSQTKFIHVGVFHRLLASCLSKWQPAKSGDKYHLFNGICEFELNGHHNLVLSINDYIIHAAVIRYTTEEEDPDLSLCITISDYMYSALKVIADCLCPSCGFEICIQCDKSPPQSNEGLHKITDLRKMKGIRCSSHTDGTDHCVTSHELLRFWEREDLSIPSSMQTAQSDHIRNNFMKVFSLVVDVGSKVLRRLLIYYTVTPTCTLDHYLKSQTKNITDLQRKKVLRKDQVDILLPQKGPTDLGQYDITLSSALLCNIVPALDPQDEPKIKDLRQERNNLMHATSIMMDTTEFKIKWTNITAALTGLIKHFKDPDFEKEILKGVKQIEQPGIDDLKTILGNYNDMKDRLEKLEKMENRRSGDQTL